MNGPARSFYPPRRITATQPLPTMSKEKIVLEFATDSLRGELFSYADIPEKWHEGDFIAELDHNDLLTVLNETADHVEDTEFEGGPGMSDNYYKVYAIDEAAFRSKLTEKLLKLLKKKFK